ncbi:MAG: DUF3987 domain-containing protein [Pseudomonadota bacterium]
MNETPQQAARRLAASAISDGYKPEALHVYTSTAGHSLHWRIRLKHPETGNKWIRPMKLNGTGYALGEPEYPEGKPLYRLRDLASRPNDPLFVVEGEQCADELIKAGALSTTSGAADSASKADWSILAGRTVNIWPDNDEAGKRYGEAVAEILRGLGCTVRMVDVEALNLPPKGDVVDWLKLHPNATAVDVLALPLVADTETPCAAQAIARWPEPRPLTAKVEPEPYPLDALPDTIRAAVEEVAGFVKAPAALVASSALAALSLACQAHIDAKRAEKLTGPVSLFLLTIADSGERKSTCDGFFTSAIRQYQEEQVEAMKPAIKEYQAAIAAWEAERDGILSAVKDAGKKCKPTDKLRGDLAQLQQDKPEPPRVPKPILGDETPENLAWSLAKLWPSAGVLSSEAGVVFGSHGMGKDSAMRNLALLNVLWDGGAHSIGRRTSESFTVRGARLTMGLMIQETTLREYFSKSGGLARGTGFLARFLVAWPESTQGQRPFTEAPANWPHLAAFHRRIAAILNQSFPIDDDGALTPAMLSLAPDAKAAWVSYHDAIESELASGGELYNVRDVASKSADNAARLAALFQQFEHGMGGAVGLDSFERASRITAWHLSEARRFFGELALPAELADAARLDSWLIEHCRRERTHMVGKNHVRQHGPLRDGGRLDAAIRELAELDRLRLEKDGKRLTIHLNPALVGVAP